MTTRLLTRSLPFPIAAALVLGAAGPAGADVPEGWSDPAPVSALDMLGLVAIAPVGAALVIALLVYLPSLVRGEGLGTAPAKTENQWFGGPTRGTAELAGPDTDESKAGGAGVRW